MLKRLHTIGLLALAALPLAAAPAHAQVFTPAFLAPTRGADTGVYLEDGFSGSDGIAVELVWRRSMGEFDLGLRGGIADLDVGAGLLLGADYRNPLELGTAPLALAVTGGVQGVIGDDVGAGVDAGVTVGGTFVLPEVSITPYIHPRIGVAGGIGNRQDLEIQVLADVGAEVSFGPDLVARLALGFGDQTADFGIGLAWR